MDDLKPFFSAVCKADLAAVERHLSESPELVHTKDDGATPLHLMAAIPI